MLVNKFEKFVTDEALKLIQMIESTTDESVREQAIQALAQRKNENIARVFIEAVGTVPWRQTKMQLLRAMGTVGEERGVEFLIRLVDQSSDLPMIAEAILALGQSQSGVAEEFLLSLLRTPTFPLHKEVLIGLRNIEFSHFDSEVENVLKNPDNSFSLLQYSILSLGHLSSSQKRSELLIPYLQHAEPMISNAAMLALGRTASPEVMEKLLKCDTRFRLFATELKLYAMDHLRSRLHLSIEDALSHLFNAQTAQERSAAVRILSEFPRDDARDAVKLFKQDIDSELELLLRITMFLPSKAEEDLAFILKHKTQISWDKIAKLVRRHVSVPRASFFQDLTKALSTLELAELLKHVFHKDSFKLLEKALSDSKNADALQTSLVNAVAAQVLMKFTDKALVEDAGKMLIRIFKTQTSNNTRARILRALGQIGFINTEVHTLFTQLLDKKDPIAGSVYFALGMQDPQEASKILFHRLKKLSSQKSEDSVQELQMALQALSQLGELTDIPDLSFALTLLKKTAQFPLLRVLSQNKMEGFETLISDALEASHYLHCLLGIAAAKRNSSKRFWGRLFHLLRSENASLKGRALHTICSAGTLEEHKKLFVWLKNQTDQKETVMKVFRSLNPKGGENYREIIQSVDALLIEKPGCFHDSEVFSSATSFRDSLSTFHTAQHPDEKKWVVSHKLDVMIQKTLEPFQSYSNAVKFVLRNAELMWLNPELFDESVDKSTMVVEYTKSIDLLLQEKFGTMLFQQTRGGVLQKMQARIIQLEFNEPYLNAWEVVQKLQCENSFQEFEFPLHKMMLLCQSISTGKIVREQYRMIDGLRAWCVIFLLFGRQFKFRNWEFESLLPIVHSENQRIKHIAVQLNTLQESRNRAAHRGVIFEKEQLQDIRQQCLKLLDEIRTLF